MFERFENIQLVRTRVGEECCGRRRRHACQRQHRSRCQRHRHSQPICEHQGEHDQRSQHTAPKATALSTRPKPDPLAIRAVSFVTELADALHRPRAVSWARRCGTAHGAPCWCEERSSSLRGTRGQASEVLFQTGEGARGRGLACREGEDRCAASDTRACPERLSHDRREQQEPKGQPHSSARSRQERARPFVDFGAVVSKNLRRASPIPPNLQLFGGTRGAE